MAPSWARSSKTVTTSRRASGRSWRSRGSICGDADLLVLDEPASALDALAERELYNQFLSLSEGKTVVLVSHRLGSARLADRVIFLERGSVVQGGTHDELMAAGGPYSELYRMQAEWYA